MAVSTLNMNILKGTPCLVNIIKKKTQLVTKTNTDNLFIKCEFLFRPITF